MNRSPLKPSRKPIRRQSAKHAKRQRVLAALLVEIIDETDGRCEVCSERCTGVIQGTHHIRKRSAGGGDDRANILGACNACNLFIEDFPGWAQAHGFSITKGRSR